MPLVWCGVVFAIPGLAASRTIPPAKADRSEGYAPGMQACPSPKPAPGLPRLPQALPQACPRPAPGPRPAPRLARSPQACPRPAPGLPQTCPRPAPGLPQACCKPAPSLPTKKLLSLISMLIFRHDSGPPGKLSPTTQRSNRRTRILRHDYRPRGHPQEIAFPPSILIFRHDYGPHATPKNISP